MIQQQVDQVMKMRKEDPDQRQASALVQEDADDESVSPNNNARNNFGSRRGKSGKNGKRQKNEKV